MNWNGFACEEVSFEGFAGYIVSPAGGTANGRLAVKTEYWGAFPHAIEIPLLQAGFHLCYIKNRCRWGADEDLNRKARFVRWVQARYDLCDTCVPIGMSCGGLMAIKFAARYPEMVSCLYLDAPVVNYMSCPCGFGDGNPLDSGNGTTELLNALQLNSMADLLAYRDMPLDNLPILVQHRIPVVMVAGGADTVVPFHENGAFLQRFYAEKGLPLEVYIKPDCGHHPHGAADPMNILRFIQRYA